MVALVTRGPPSGVGATMNGKKIFCEVSFKSPFTRRGTLRAVAMEVPCVPKPGNSDILPVCDPKHSSSLFKE
jgi:hypothetical protein